MILVICKADTHISLMGCKTLIFCTNSWFNTLLVALELTFHPSIRICFGLTGLLILGTKQNLMRDGIFKKYCPLSYTKKQNSLQEINTLIINFLVEKVLKSFVSSTKSKVFGLASLNFSCSEHMGIFPKHQSSWSFWNQKKKLFFLMLLTL